MMEVHGHVSLDLGQVGDTIGLGDIVGVGGEFCRGIALEPKSSRATPLLLKLFKSIAWRAVLHTGVSICGASLSSEAKPSTPYLALSSDAPEKQVFYS